MKKLIVTFLLVAPMLGHTEIKNDDQASNMNILSVVTLDINADGISDRAMLQASADTQSDTADLILYISSDDAESGHAIIVKESIAFYSTFMQEMTPSLSVGGKGNSLIIHSEYIGASLTAWEKTLTVVYRKNQLLVGGMSYMYRDRLSTKVENCDINFLTGKGFKNGKRVNEKLVPIKLDDWTDASEPAACYFD